MPVIRPHSEYKKKFRWHESVKSASFTPSKQQGAVIAGLSSYDSAKTYAQIREPAFQHKKKSIDSAAKMTYTTNQFFRDISTESECTSVDEQWNPTKPSGNDFATISKPVKNSSVVTDNNFKTRVISKEQDKSQQNTANSMHNASKKTHRQAEEQKNNNNQKTTTKINLKDKDEDQKALTKKNDKNKDEVNRAVQYQVGIRAPKSGAPKLHSEYQRQFAWKKPIYKESPLIAAEQMVYNSNANIAPYVAHKFPMNSEYQTQFKPWQQKTQHSPKEQLKKTAEREIKAKYRIRTKRKKKRGLTPEKMRAAGIPSTIVHEDPSLVRKAQNPQVPFFPHANLKKWKSEYNSNFKSPAKFNYDGGVWRGADPPQIQPRDDSSDRDNTGKPDKNGICPTVNQMEANWFKEVSELRERAKEYKKKARGTHFSREHLAQLLAEQAKLWDQMENGSDENLEKGIKEDQRIPAGISSRKHDQVDVRTDPVEDKSPVRRKLAWQQENENNNDNNSSIGSIPTPNGFRDSSTSSIMETLNEDGRVPTPRLTDEGAKQRHHFDRTTPHTGGALLTSPVPRRKAEVSPSLHPNPLKPIYKPSNRIYAIDKSPPRPTPGLGLTYIPGGNQHHGSGDEYDDTPHKVPAFHSKITKVQRPLLATAGMRSNDHDPLNDDLSEHPFTRHSEHYFETSPQVMPGNVMSKIRAASEECGDRKGRDRPRYTTGQGPLDQAHSGTLNGRPQTAMPKSRLQTVADDPLTDDSESTLSSAKQARGKLAAKSVKTKPSQAWSIHNEDIHPSLGVSKLDDIDQMSVSAISSVSSCSLASDVLDRARKRRDNFWAK